MILRIGSMFSGLGGLDLACEWAFTGSTAWQLDQTGEAVRRRHWPDALQVVEDVRAINPLALPAVDVLCGGFPCQDLSVAGKQAGLGGERSGLYREVLRFAGAILPRFVVMENVPGLLNYQGRLEADWRALGYGLTWAPCMALDAGAPHLRARVFVVAERGGFGRGVVTVPDGGRWRAENERAWPTPTAANPNESEDATTWQARRAIASELHGNNGIGEPLGQAVRPWATLTASEDKGRRVSIGRRDDPDMLTEQVRPWASPTVSDARAGWTQEDAERADRRNLLGDQLGGKRLNPAWVETLMGLPQGWTDTEGPRLTADPSPRWPRGRYPADWDRSIPWPGYDWEPSRTLPDGPPCPGRPARIRLCGNAVVPQQGALAIRAAMEPAQASLWGGK